MSQLTTLAFSGGGVYTEGAWLIFLVDHKKPTEVCSSPLTPGVVRQTEAVSQTVNAFAGRAKLSGAGGRQRADQARSGHLQTTCRPPADHLHRPGWEGKPGNCCLSVEERQQFQAGFLKLSDRLQMKLTPES